MNNRHIFLYIDGKAADIATDSLVLLNYAASDLSSPAAVKNTYSQQVNLPATAKNDAIFSSIYRADHRTVLGDPNSFNPLVRTPFAIYDNTGAILESGYLKLNTIKNKDGVRTYVATLYGGLGSFFYSLAYDENDEALSLGALPLLSDDPTEKVDFPITAETVAKAWARLKNQSLSNYDDRQFDAVNFAPAYNGLPEGEFDASKGIGRPGEVGGTTHKDEYTVWGPDGVSLYDLGGDFTEWETKDLRSYLQRPVVSVKALVEGIVRYAAARGFSVYLDPAWFSNQNPYYRRAWMTLRQLAGRSVPIAINEKFAIRGMGSLKVASAGNYSYLHVPLTPTIEDTGANVTVKCKPLATIKPMTLLPSGTNTIEFNMEEGHAGILGMIMFVQVQLLNIKGEIIGASSIRVCMSNPVETSTTGGLWVNLADLKGCDTIFGTEQKIYYSPLNKRSVNEFAFDYLGEIEVTATDAVSARVCFEPRAIIDNGGYISLTTTVDLQCVKTRVNTPIEVAFWSGMVVDGTLEYSLPEQYRSGVRVTQEALFADTMSPMEFLLSYTKTFGLHYLYNTAQKRVQILTRNTLYGNRKTVDLQQRIDRSKEIKTTPIPMTAKWLEFAPASVEGEFADYYRTKYGREYGMQRINTGYEFDANTSQVLDGAKFNGAPEVLERSTYYLKVRNTTAARIPAPTVNGKATYKLYRNDDTGERQSIDIDYPNPTGTGFQRFDYFNANHGYDGVSKLQCHGADNSTTDGAGILLFHRGLASEDPSASGDPAALNAYKDFILTDDTTAMYELAGKPCWELSDGLSAADMPAFGRFDLEGVTIKRSMEFGIPAELDNPAIAVGENTSVYERFWAKYMTDRNNVDTRVCTAYVDLRGFQPGPEMLRDFYYFDGSIWLLNKIANYSLTTPGTTQCEFVKVQEQANYASGQLLDIGNNEITIRLRTDGTNLYVDTSRPLQDDEMAMILTRGSGRVKSVKSGTKYFRSQNHWHVPRFYLLPHEGTGRRFRLGNNGLLEYAFYHWYRWGVYTNHKGVKHVDIIKANHSKLFGYKKVEGMRKAVTFAVAVYRQQPNKKAIAISNRCYFQNMVTVKNGEMEQQFITTQ